MATLVIPNIVRDFQRNKVVYERRIVETDAFWRQTCNAAEQVPAIPFSPSLIARCTLYNQLCARGGDALIGALNAFLGGYSENESSSISCLLGPLLSVCRFC